MKNSINLVQALSIKSSEIFKLWLLTYSVINIGFLGGILLAATNDTAGTIICGIVAIALLVFYLKNIAKEYEFLRFIKNTILNKSNHFQKEIKTFFSTLVAVFILDIFLIGIFINFFLKSICFYIYIRIKKKIKRYENEIFEVERNKKIQEKYEKLEEKMKSYKIIVPYYKSVENIKKLELDEAGNSENSDSSKSDQKDLKRETTSIKNDKYRIKRFKKLKNQDDEEEDEEEAEDFRNTTSPNFLDEVSEEDKEKEEAFFEEDNYQEEQKAQEIEEEGEAEEDNNEADEEENWDDESDGENWDEGEDDWDDEDW